MKPENIRYLKLKYSFETSTGAGELGESDFFNEYTIDIYGCDIPYNDDNTSEVLIGKATVLQFLLEHLTVKGYPIDYLLSDNNIGARGYTGDFILDRNTGMIKPEYEELLTDNGNWNILFLDSVVLFPEYQGYGYGRFIIKEIISRFYCTVGLVLTIVYPLQLDAASFSVEMRYHQMDQDEEYSSFKLYQYFLDIGFEQIGRSNYFLIDPFKNNNKLDSIDLSMSFDEAYYNNLKNQNIPIIL